MYRDLHYPALYPEADIAAHIVPGQQHRNRASHYCNNKWHVDFFSFSKTLHDREKWNVFYFEKQEIVLPADTVGINHGEEVTRVSNGIGQESSKLSFTHLLWFSSY